MCLGIDIVFSLTTAIVLVFPVTMILLQLSDESSQPYQVNFSTLSSSSCHVPNMFISTDFNLNIM